MIIKTILSILVLILAVFLIFGIVFFVAILDLDQNAENHLDSGMENHG